MKSYLKYVALFIILVLIGIVSINFYSNSKQENTFKSNKPQTSNTTETIKETNNKKEEKTKTEKSKTEPKQETKKEENVLVVDSTKKNTTTTTTETPAPETKGEVTYVTPNQDTTTTETSPQVSQEETAPRQNNTTTSSPRVRAGQYTLRIDPNEYQSSSTNNNTEEQSTLAPEELYDEDGSILEIEEEKEPLEPEELYNEDGTVMVEEKEPLQPIEIREIKDGDLIGATGYSALNKKKYLKSKPSNKSDSIVVLKRGVPFEILSTNSKDTWWKVKYNGKVGYVENTYCMINLPDYIPSITYKITNASKNISKSSGEKLSITGTQLYKSGKVWNERLDKNEYIVPVVYSFAKKILKAQQQALKEGYSLKIYDAYRPTSVAEKMKKSLDDLYNNNAKVKKNIDYSYDKNGKKSTWGKNWFIAQNLSSHSLGAAIDVTLTKKGSTKNLKMPSKINELSTKSIKYTSPISGQTKVRKDLYADTMTTAAKKLDRIMLNNGMTNLASEWWHFQDNDAYQKIKSIEPNGLNFQPIKIASTN